MDTLKTSVGHLGTTVATATVGTTKLVSNVVTLATKTADQGVALSGKTLDAGFAIGEGAVGAVKDLGVATTQATGKIGVAALSATSQLSTTALKEPAAVGSNTLEGASKTLQAGSTAVFNLSERTLKGVDTLSRIAAGSGANTAARIETSQAATATGIAARAPEKTRKELLRVFDTEVMTSMRDLLKVAGATQLANLQYQVGVFKNVHCYGTSGFFKRYFSTHPCPRQRPANTADNDILSIKTFTQQKLMELDSLAKTIRFEFGSVSGDVPTAYPGIVEKFRQGAASLADQLSGRYTPLIKKYTDLNDKFFAGSQGGRRPRKTRRRSRKGTVSRRLLK
jgi:hypothetical protein